MNGWTTKDIPNQSGRVVVITGANSGVGYESALALARKGAHIIMACRNASKAEHARQQILQAVPEASVEVMQLDLGDLASVHNFADHFNSIYQRLDILMNNAGIMTPPYGTTADGFETQFGTNHLGHFALTGLLLPNLLQTPASRVVTVSSSAYMMNARINFDDLQSEKQYSPFAAYGQSKLANILFTMELQRKLELECVDTISVASHPGYAITNLQKKPSNIIAQISSNMFAAIASQNATLGAMYQLYAATAPDVKGGDFYGPRLILRGEIVRVDLNARGKDRDAAARLWQISEELTGVHYEVFNQPVYA